MNVGRFYFYKDKWFLYLELDEVDSIKYVVLIVLFVEFGEGFLVMLVVMEEYGKVIMFE